MTAADFARWLPTMIGVVSGPAGAGLIVAWWKHRENTREQTDDVAMDLVRELKDRVGTLESDAVEERKICDAKIASLQSELKGVLSELRGVLSDFDAVMMALAVAPEKAAEIVAMIKARRSPPSQGAKRQRDQISLSAAHLSRDE